GTLTRDVTRAVGWVHAHISEYGGDPKALFIMGHSAGAQLAALLCTDERYRKAEGVSLANVRGCVPVDGDTYDVPLMIETAAARSSSGCRLTQPPGAGPGSERDPVQDVLTHVWTGARDPPVPHCLGVLLHAGLTGRHGLQGLHVAVGPEDVERVVVAGVDEL